MAIRFVNSASKTANLVHVAVDSHGRRFIIRDVGKFSPYVQIARTYRNCAGLAFVLPRRSSCGGESQATYRVKPVAPGSCTARIIDEDGNVLTYPIVVR